MSHHCQGNISAEEMSRTFNCGIGLCLIVNENEVEHVCDVTGGAVLGKLLPKVGGMCLILSVFATTIPAKNEYYA